MLALWVKMQNLWQRVRDRQEGMSMIEYGVLGAFIVLLLVGAAVTVGPRLQDWIVDTVDDIINGRGR